jgi:outer membrane lipoprotein-sorting protein
MPTKIYNFKEGLVKFNHMQLRKKRREPTAGLFLNSIPGLILIAGIEKKMPSGKATLLSFPVFLLFLFIFTTMHLDLLGQPPGFSILKDTASLKAKLAQTAARTKTIESDFIQEKNLSVLSEKIITKGHFYFKRENMVRWEYTHPFSYLIIINKNKVLIKDESKENKYDMKSNKMFQEINNMIVNSIQGKILNTGEFKYHFYSNEYFFLVELIPLAKNLKGMIKTIQLYFDKTSYAVSKLNMEELSGDYTLISFINRKENKDIADEKFFIK